MTIQGHSSLHLLSPRAQYPIRTANSTSVLPQRGRSPLTVQLPVSPIEGSLEWLWYSPTSVFEHLSDSGSPTLIQTPLPQTSPSPPRLPLRPNCMDRGSSFGRSNPLLSIRRDVDSRSRHSFALSRFNDIKVENESPSRTFISSPHDSVTSSPIPPPIPPLLLARSISPSFRRRGKWRRWRSLQMHPAPGMMKGSEREGNIPSSSCLDLLANRETGSRILPTRVNTLHVTSDIARKRCRKKLEARQRQLDGSASD